MSDEFIVIETGGPQGPAGVSTGLVFSVRDYGAVADGTTDDKAAFVAAIAAANALGGGTVYVPSGSYRISSAITPSNQKNIRIIGEGWAASKIKATAGFIFAGTTSDQWTIEDLQIECTTSTNTSHGIRVDIPRRWRISRCYFIGFGGDSVRFDGGIHSEVEFCYFSAKDPSTTNGHAGFYVTVSGAEFATTITSNHNYIGEAKGYGILFDRVTGGSSFSDVFEFCTTAGLRVDNCTNMQVYQPYFEANVGPSSQYFDSSAVLIGADTEDAPAVTWSGATASQRIFTRISRDDVNFGASVTTSSGAGQTVTYKFKLNDVLKAYLEYNGSTDTLRVDSDGAITLAPSNTLAATITPGSMILQDVTASSTPSMAVKSGSAGSPFYELNVNGAQRAYLKYDGGSDDLRLDSDGTITFAPNNASSLRLLTNNDVTALAGNLIVDTVGKGLKVKEGTNAKMGLAVLVGGTVVVSTTAVTASSRIFLDNQVLGGTAGFLRVSARTAGTSFTILSSSGTDTSSIAWMIVEPA